MHGLVGVHIPSENRATKRFDSQFNNDTTTVNFTRDNSDLSSLIYLTAFILHDQYGSAPEHKYYHTSGALLDTSFTGQRPVIGEGFHFMVLASPFEKWEKVPAHVKRYNP